jgi:hypothetical protein
MIVENQSINLFEKGPIILDDFLDKDIEEKILDIVSKNAEFAFGASYGGTCGIKSSDLVQKYKINNIYEQPQSVHTSKSIRPFMKSKDLDYKQDTPSNYLYPYLIYPLMKACMKLGFNVEEEEIVRVKTNLQTRAPESSRGKYSTPHIDNTNSFNIHMLSAIYYLDDSDGDTYFFEGDVSQVSAELLRGDNETEERANFLNNLKVFSKVSPKKGRIVFFPCVWLHAGSCPIDYSLRIATNYNFFIK